MNRFDLPDPSLTEKPFLDNHTFTVPMARDLSILIAQKYQLIKDTFDRNSVDIDYYASMPFQIDIDHQFITSEFKWDLHYRSFELVEFITTSFGESGIRVPFTDDIEDLMGRPLYMILEMKSAVGNPDLLIGGGRGDCIEIDPLSMDKLREILNKVNDPNSFGIIIDSPDFGVLMDASNTIHILQKAIPGKSYGKGFYKQRGAFIYGPCDTRPDKTLQFIPEFDAISAYQKYKNLHEEKLKKEKQVGKRRRIAEQERHRKAMEELNLYEVSVNSLQRMQNAKRTKLDAMIQANENPEVIIQAHNDALRITSRPSGGLTPMAIETGMRFLAITDRPHNDSSSSSTEIHLPP